MSVFGLGAFSLEGGADSFFLRDRFPVKRSSRSVNLVNEEDVDSGIFHSAVHHTWS